MVYNIVILLMNSLLRISGDKRTILDSKIHTMFISDIKLLISRNYINFWLSRASFVIICLVDKCMLHALWLWLYKLYYMFTYNDCKGYSIYIHVFYINIFTDLFWHPRALYPSLGAIYTDRCIWRTKLGQLCHH